SPNGGNFTDKVDVTVTAKNATSAWYKIGNGAQKNFTSTASFTLGSDMAEGQSVTVTWSATNGTDTKTGSVTYTKVAKPTGYVAYFDNSKSNWGKVYAYTWTGNEQHHGAWPGKEVTETKTIEGKTCHVVYVPVAEANTQIIFNDGNGNQTADFDFKPNGLYTVDGFQHTVQEIISAVESILDGEDAEPEFYTLQGIRVNEPAPGIYIVRRGNKTAKVVIR
ncbi:MAG: starch-binding protein, partial [Muribaculaceae bacterium]|nr:starch-binding protein [Muribaculaceae bacterium]